jgi:hypothetical protein
MVYRVFVEVLEYALTGIYIKLWAYETARGKQENHR